MTDKKQWGGKRPNQTGRPPNRKGVKRVQFHCMIDPATRDQIKHISEQKKLSAGQIIDEWAEGSKKGKL
jgi:predicted nucleotide-binding protein (sugar kinase/HSP70/actin superfamily)